MKSIGLFIVFALLLVSCTIPIPKPSTTEMAMDNVPYEWTYQESDIAWVVMNEQVDY